MQLVVFVGIVEYSDFCLIRDDVAHLARELAAVRVRNACNVAQVMCVYSVYSLAWAVADLRPSPPRPSGLCT